LITPDGKTLITASWDETIRFSDLATGDCFKILKGHSGRIWAIALTRDGKTLVSGSQDKTIKIWGMSP
jgi:WD40 repeat protein